MLMQTAIERVAKIFYERSGKIEGRDLDNWLLAERYMSVWCRPKKRMMTGAHADRRKRS